MGSTKLLAVAGALLTGCVLHDGSADVRLLPEGPIVVSAPFVLFIETEARGDPTLLLDGEEDRRGTPPLNTQFTLDLSASGEGPHTLQILVHDGVHRLESNVVSVTVEARAPVASPPPTAGQGAAR